MGDITILQLLWFVLIGVLFSGFFFLEGFDFGVGMAGRTLAHNKQERDQLVQTIGPTWDGNEVWLLTAGGAMFASYPYWYASLFSGFYLILFIILFGLIIRGVSFEFRHRMPTEKGRNLWDWTLACGSFIAPFFFGLMFTAMVKGMPMDEKGNITAHFTDYVNLFTLVGGVAVTLLCYLHGLNFIALKTDGPIRQRARDWANKLYFVLYAGLVVFAVLLYFNTTFFDNHFVLTLVTLALMVAITVLAHIFVVSGKEMSAFISSGLTFILLVFLLFQGLFPNVMIDKDGINNIAIADASSSPYTLKVMTIVTISILPFVLAYTAWTYYVFHKRIKHTDAPSGY